MISSLELAKLCGVSQGTVDRALHDRPGISEKTKAKVLAMAEQHGYMANPSALEIMGKRNTMVGVLTPALNSPVLMQMVQSIQDVISTKGYRTFTSFFKNKEPFVDSLREFAARKAAAVIVFPAEPFPKLPDNLCKATKVISLMEPVDNEHAFFVSPDNHQIGHVCTQKLISLGHKNILMLNLNADRLTSRERQRGYEEAMQESNLDPIVLGHDKFDDLLDVVKANNITGIYGHTDGLVFRAMKVLSENGYHVPNDISLLGGQDHPPIRDHFPEISNYDYPIGDIAKGILAVLENEPIPTVGAPIFREGKTLKTLNS